MNDAALLQWGDFPQTYDSFQRKATPSAPLEIFPFILRRRTYEIEERVDIEFDIYVPVLFFIFMSRILFEYF